MGILTCVWSLHGMSITSNKLSCSDITLKHTALSDIYGQTKQFASMAPMAPSMKCLLFNKSETLTLKPDMTSYLF